MSLICWGRAHSRAVVRLLLSLTFTAVVSAASAQQTGRIVGRVVSAESGAPISEAQIFIPGLGLGTLSRQSGNFTMLGVPAGTYDIRVERIGLTPLTQQFTLLPGGAVELSFSMGMQALGLDEIVVTGTAGASRQREVGNSIAQISVADVPTRPTDAAVFLQSAAPGIQVNRGDGGLGQGYNIRLRGNRTVSMTNQPIIYVDGIRMQSKPFPVGNSGLASQANGGSANISASPLNDINPSDIERIEVIKGSAATTLYGTEASSGVIQVFTKRGSSGAAVWSFELSQDQAQAIKFGTEKFPYLRLDPYLKKGLVGDYSASVRGGNQSLQYFVSGGLERGTGILPSDSIAKYTARSNFTFTPAKGVEVQLNNSFAFQDQRNSPVGGNVYGITLNGYRGIANYMTGARRDSPEVLRELFDQELTIRIERFSTGATVNWSPLSKLSNRVTVGYDFSDQETRNVLPFGFSLFPQGQVWNDTWQNRLLTVDYVGSYTFDLASALRSRFSWGGQTTSEEELRINAYGENFPGAANPTVTSAASKTSEEDRSKVWNAGFFFQNVFELKDRYFLTLGGRVDGNSAFGSSFGLQVYPKASASWVLSDEAFWPDAAGAVKLRAAYGKAGRAPGAFDATRTWSPEGWGGKSALVPKNLGSGNLGPEVTAELEAGLDGEWFEGRVSSTFSYYNQTTSNALFNVLQIPTTGFSGSQRENVGKMRNSGIELGLNVVPIRGAVWELDVGVNLTTNHSKVLDLGGIPPFSIGGSGWVEEGYPAPVLRTRWIRNGDVAKDPIQCTAAAAVADPTLPCIDNAYIHGPTQPTRTVSPTLALKVPLGITLSARGEYRGGHFMTQGVTSGGVTRSGWMDVCWPYYVSPYEGADNDYSGPGPQHNYLLKPETPALFRAMCSPSLGNGGYNTTPADFFVLRGVSAEIPVGFAFPGSSRASLTLSLNNAFYWFNSKWQILTPEMGNVNSLIQSPGTGVPPTYSVNASLRVQL